MNARKLTTRNTVNDFVKNAPREVLEFFRDQGIDTCCGGDRSLADACRDQGLSPDTFPEQLSALRNTAGPEPGPPPENLSSVELIEHILDKHHRYLKEEFPKFDGLFEKTLAAHAANHPELKELQRYFNLLRNDLLPHMEKEERVLFPMIRALAAGVAPEGIGCGSVEAPIRVMRMEHETVLDILRKMRRAAMDYKAPQDACTTYQHLLERLEDLESNTQAHITKENDILFAGTEGR